MKRKKRKQKPTRITEPVKRVVIDRAKKIVDRIEVRKHKACLYWARAVEHVLTSMGHRAIIQAGTMHWPIVRPEDDDGVSATHFSYMWEPDSPVSQRAVALGFLPEMHVWCALPDRQEIIDPTTQFLPQQTLETAGLAWREAEPPEYLWCSCDALPDRVGYIPNLSATGLALSILEKDLAPLYRMLKDIL